MQRNTPLRRRGGNGLLLPPETARNVLFLMLGVGALVLKGRYSGLASDLVHSYGGNAAASFAVYFWARLATDSFLAAHRGRRGKRPGSDLSGLLAAGLALLIVQLFEMFDGFGVMSNVYDRLDFAANAVGIAIAFTVDAAARRAGRRRVRIEPVPTSTTGGDPSH